MTCPIPPILTHLKPPVSKHQLSFLDDVLVPETHDALIFYTFKVMIFALILLVLAFSENGQVGAVPRFFQHILHPNSHTVLYNTRLPTSNSSFELNKRQELRRDNTCGFYDGDASKPRTAEPGFACRVDIKNGIWGFCPTSVIAATDCGLAGACVDSHACTDGCGIIGETTITTASWYVEEFSNPPC
jgi:hypothetical protein